MASSSLVTSAKTEKELAYLYASNANVSNFVSVRLSGDRNYHLWKTQMLCLLEAHGMRGLVDEYGPKHSRRNTGKEYDILLRGWIFGSLSEDVLRIVVHHQSAKPVWNDLESIFGSYKWSDQQEIGIKEEEMNSDAKREDAAQTKTEDSASIEGDTTAKFKKGRKSTESLARVEESTQIGTKDSDPKKANTTKDKNLEETTATDKVSATEGEDTNKTTNNDAKNSTESTNKEAPQTGEKGSSLTMPDVKQWFEAFLDGDMTEIQYLLRDGEGDGIKNIIDKDGNSILHIAVALGRKDIIKKILWNIDGDNLTKIKNKKGSTVLHIAAIVGNTDVAKLLLKEDINLLHIKDNLGKKPLLKAYENMRLETAYLLLKATNDEKIRAKNAPTDDQNSPLKSNHVADGGKNAATVHQNSTLKSNTHDEDFSTGIGVLVQAISAKQYDIVEKMINQQPDYVVYNDEVLMALARTFPSGIDNLEAFFCPSFEDMREKILGRTKASFVVLLKTLSFLKEDIISPLFRCSFTWRDLLVGIFLLLMLVPLVTIVWMFHLIRLPLLMAYFCLYMLYYLSWKTATIIVPHIKEIELKKKEYEDAKKVLRLVFKLISEKYGADDVSSRKLYSRPILEAACQDAYDIVDGILEKWPEAIICKDEKGHNIIQLATMHRSLKIYNLIYTFKEHSNDDYGTMEDSSENNMLHLAGRLAPLNKLKRHTGAALQLQSELQWHQEVRNIMFPSYVTKKNIFGETPEMVFTREHENLVNEGEKWIKAVAESCSITAALITTIVFAAAITVPGGSSQAGVPVFTNEIAFAVLALSDAISLFTSVTALLVFLSILTSRFSEQDFLDHLPGRLFIGLCTLLVSTTAMMVAFSATLFLVFCHQKFWVIAPICGLAILPIAFFIVLQFPLVLDLFRSTCISRFGKLNLHNSKLNPTDLKFFFADKDEGSHHEQEKKKPKKSNKGGGMSFKRSETHKAKRPPNSHEPTATSI